MFNYFKKKAIENRVNDEILYEYVTEELEKNIKVKGLWAKSYANSEGNDNKVEPLYMQYRVQAIKDEFSSLEIMYNELSRQKIFDFISSGFKDVIVSVKPEIDKSESKTYFDGIYKEKNYDEKNEEFMNTLFETHTCIGQQNFRKNGTDEIYQLNKSGILYKLDFVE